MATSARKIRLGWRWRPHGRQSPRSIPAYLAVIVSVDLPTLDAGGSFVGNVGERLIERRGICHYCGLIKCPLLAPFGRGAMSDLSPLSGEERKSNFEAARSVDDPNRKSGRARNHFTGRVDILTRKTQH